MEFSIKDFFSKCDQIRRNLRDLLKKSLVENFIFCAVQNNKYYHLTRTISFLIIVFWLSCLLNFAPICWEFIPGLLKNKLHFVSPIAI